MARPALLAWLDDPGPTALHFAHRTGGQLEWTRLAQEQLAASVRAAAGVLADAGVRPGSSVIIALGSTPAFVSALFGSIGIGAVPTPIEPPAGLRDRTASAERILALVARLDPVVLVGEPHLAGLLARLPAASSPRLVTPTALAAGDPTTPMGFGGQWALAQLTSGTSGRPKRIDLTAEQISDHVEAIWRWLDMGPADVGVSWLPLHHDMGLIGHLLLPLAMGIDQHLMPPLTFIREPSTWLRTMSDVGGTITASPTFGYRYLLDRTDEVAGAGLDLSRCRAAIVGAERVDADVLGRFARRYAGCGLRAAALRPAYGLAEATLAVTGDDGATPATVVRVRATPIPLGGSVEIIDRPGLDAPLDDTMAGSELLHVSCGRPLRGTTVRVEVDDRSVGPRVVGEIVVEAPWLGAIDGGAGGPLRTGDAGFVLDGELYVVGRLGDSLSVRGRRVFAPAVEASIAGLAGRPPVVAMGDSIEGAVVICLVEGRTSPEVRRHLRAAIGRQVDDGTRSVLVEVPVGATPRTTSGKPRRHVIWESFTKGLYDERIVDGADR